ncbi:MAG: Fic family protein [Acidobacteriota bacterium]|nr:Fic family protein [Acidobacteriota bacterium]
MSLTSIPFQRSWAEALQNIQLKREVAGTSRIEGADFTEQELEVALKESPRQSLNRSQRQARAALITYKWLATLPDDLPINEDLVFEVHRRIVTDADDDHCPPGVLRGQDQNVNFGYPRHRGAEGGAECDPLIQALALHYHFAAIHPFLDGNGRTARALEALLLQRAGLRDTLFIAMSNYYYDEKDAYLTALSDTRASNHELTTFLKFGLRGIALQCQRLFAEIKKQISTALFRNMMYDLFNRLETTRKRVIADRQLAILKLLLEADETTLENLFQRMQPNYQKLKAPLTALQRDVTHLTVLGAVEVEKVKEIYWVKIRLEWTTEITETEFFEKVKKLPTAKIYPFL